MKNPALPTPEQAAWHDMEIGMFIHWAPNVYQELQYDNLSTPLSEIDPYALDTEQWAEVAAGMGAKYIIMVAKHAGGFCMWQTDTTDYGIKNTPWRGGKGDVMKDLAQSCAKRGIKLGVYISPCDWHLGADVGGKCKTPEAQAAYDKIYRAQLTELLTRYGEMCEVWFDGSTSADVGDILQKYAPGAMKFQSPWATIRWVGNENGIAEYPAWNSLAKADADTGIATRAQSDPDGDAWMPLECDTTIRKDWFWSTENHTTLKSIDELMELYYQSVGNGAVLLLNSNPDRSGLIPEEDAARARDFGDEIRRRFSVPIAEMSGCGQTLDLDLGAAAQIDHIVLAEDIKLGERVREFAIEGFSGCEWIPLASGTAVGHKRIIRLEPVRITKVRLSVKQSVAEPVWKMFAAYGTGSGKGDRG